MTASKKRILTGSRPSGIPHLGNYFGAYRQFLAYQDRFDLFFFLADFHTLNTETPPAVMRQQSFEMIATLLACGLEPDQSLLFAQSAVPEVNELAWMLACHAPYGMLARAHSFKDAQAKGIDVNMGVFNYPVLMAADILLYDAAIVPVGQDQKQHLEMARDMAQRFNNRFGPELVVPEPMISEDVAVVPGTDGEKMSKSKNNTVPLFATDKQWKTAIMAIVTDPAPLEAPKDPTRCTVFALYKLLASADETAALAAKYRGGGFGYGHAKLELLEKVKERFSAERDRFFELMQRPDDLRDVVMDGSRRARKLAVAKLERLHEVLGLIGRPF